jgi:hypothetical protein
MLGAIGILLDIELSRNDVKTPANQIPGPWYPHSEDTSDLSNILNMPSLNMQKKLPNPFYNSTLYKSDDGESVLKLSDYYDPLYHPDTLIESRIKKLLENKEVTRAAAYALFCRKMKRTIEILESAEDDNETSAMSSKSHSISHRLFDITYSAPPKSVTYFHKN